MQDRHTDISPFVYAVVSPAEPRKKSEGLKCLQSVRSKVRKRDSLAAKWKTVLTLCCAMALLQCVN